MQAEPVWEAAREQRPGFSAANICWWYAMGMTTNMTVTPRPIYYSDGAKEPDCYTDPPELHDRLTDDFGTFPLFNYWGPTASIKSSKWIASAAWSIVTTDRPDLTLVYLPAPRLRPAEVRPRRAGGDRRRAGDRRGRDRT